MGHARDQILAGELGGLMRQIIDALIETARKHQPPYREGQWRTAIGTKFGIHQCDFTAIKTYTRIIDFGHGNNHGPYFSGRRTLQIDNFQRLDTMLRSFGFDPPKVPDAATDLPGWRRWLHSALSTIGEARKAAQSGSVAAASQRSASRVETSAFPPSGKVIGRQETVAALSGAAITAGARILVLGGPGLGKTTVAIAVGNTRQVLARFGRRRWFVPLDDIQDVAALRDRVASRLGIGLDPREPERVLLDNLDRAPGLLILDNLETPWEPELGRRDVERLLGALAGLPDLTLLVTMRGHEAPADLCWVQEHLPPLTRRAARGLFLDEAQTIRPHDPRLREFLDALGGIPLAVRLVALRASGRTNLESLWQDWKTIGVALAARLQTNLDKLSSLQISIALSLGSPRLTAAGEATFALLGQLPAGLAMADRAALLGSCDVDGPGELLTLGLAYERDDRLDLLPPIRDYARRLRRPADDTMRRWIRRYLNLALDLGEKIGTQQGRDASGRLQQESANVDAAFTAAPDYALLDDALAAAPGFARAGRLTRFGSVTVLERLLAACRDSDARAQTANLHLALGDVAWSRSMREKAVDAFTEGLALYETANDRLGQARCHRGLGDTLMGKSLSVEARRHYERALTLLDPDALDYADVVARLGRLESEVGNEALGRQHLTRARALYEATVAQTGEVFGWAHCVFRLAEMDRWRGDFDTARSGYQKTEELCTRGGIALGHANARKGLGDIALQEGCLRDAVRLFAYARKQYHRLGSVNNEGNAVRGLGDVAAARASMPRAQRLWRAALRSYEIFDDGYNIGTIHLRLARACTGQARLEELARAEKAWLAVGRDDLVARYLVPLRQHPHAPADAFEQGPF